ncbi:uncharacterized protein FYW61_007156 [Anableps anableps]
MDLHQVVSSISDLDLQPLSLEDSWRLRVFSAQVFSIVRNRDMKNFERVMDFLDATHRLLPRLVPAIKHMKILFGLKTMVIMWMLREGRRKVHIVSNIIRFFPNKLPQYEDQCSQREMFLMRKNHADFKSLAQSLAITKERLEDYMKNDMEEQYGERYAQKVEDRLLDYLHELQKVLPGNACMKMMKNQSPEDEEQLLLDVRSSDSSAERKLLLCDVPASCRPLESQPGGEPPPDDGGDMEVGPGSSGSSADVGEEEQPEDRGEAAEEACTEKNSEGAEDGSSSSPQFCSRHQRWVKNILRGCPDEELQSNVSLSPVLFQSSSSSSSQDLTPSNLAQPPSHTSTQPPPSEAPGEHLRPEGSVRPVLLVPVVRLVDILSAGLGSKPSSSHHFSVVLPKQASSGSGLLASSAQRTSEDQNLPAGSGPVLGRRTVSRLSRKFRRLASSEQVVKVSGPPSSPGACRSEPAVHPAPQNRASVGLVDPSQQRVHQNSIRPRPKTQNSRTIQSKLLPGSPVTARTSTIRTSSRTSNFQGHQERPPSLTQTNRLQPNVVLTRLSAEECLRATEGRASAWWADEEETMKVQDCSFDVNVLYSCDSSSSESEARPGRDPDYRPHVNRKRFLSEVRRIRS